MVRLDNNLQIPDELGGGVIGIIDRDLVKTTAINYLEPQPVYQYPAIKDPAPIYNQPVTKPTNMTKTIRVIDDLGTPLPGAHVYFDQTTGVTTDFDGNARVSTTDGNRQVTVSYVGFKPRTFTFNALPATVALEMDQSLGEVIITAPAKAAATDSKVPKYLFPAIGGLALLLILMSASGSSKPEKVTL